MQPNNLLGTPPPRPATAGSPAASHRSDRFGNVRRSLNSLKETVSQRAGPGTSRGDMQAALSHSQQQQHGSPMAAASSPHASLRPIAAGGQSDAHLAWKDVKDSAHRLQQHVALEVRRRTEGQKALQQLVDARAAELSRQLEQKTQERMLDLHKNVDLLTKRVDVLQKELAAEREKNVRLTQEMKFQATQGMQDVKGALDHERAQRQEKEALLAKKLSEDVFRLQERLDVERHARDAMVAAVKDDLVAATKSRHKSDERLLQELLEDVKGLKAALAEEHEERERSEEHLAAAMNDIVTQVHSGLQSLARGA